MKKIVALCAAAAAFVIAGCKTLPSEDVMKATSESIGRAAGYAVELGKVKDEVKGAIVSVLDVAAKVVPASDQTFAEAWRPIVDEEIGKLVAAGKLKEADAALAKGALYVTCDGVDLIFARYPKAKQYSNLVSAAVNGFSFGFKSVVTATVPRAPYDEKAYKTLRAKFEAM